MTNLYDEKLYRLSDEDLMAEAAMHGKIMERGWLTKEEKIRAIACFTLASQRETLIDEREVLLTALRVMRLF